MTLLEVLDSSVTTIVVMVITLFAVLYSKYQLDKHKEEEFLTEFNILLCRFIILTGSISIVSSALYIISKYYGYC